MPPHGGFAIGLERLTCQVLNPASVRQAVLYQRDRPKISPRSGRIRRYGILPHVGKEPMRITWILAAVLTSSGVVSAQNNTADQWSQPFPPHKIVGNLYYVGSSELASFLITTPDGNILINSDFERTVPVIRAAVE